MLADTQSTLFEESILPHLDAAYNLARWLVRNGTDSEDLVQEACLRAWKSFAGFRGGDGRGWLLTQEKREGYNLLYWSQDGMTFWAVSDLANDEMRALAHLLQSKTGQISE